MEHVRRRKYQASRHRKPTAAKAKLNLFARLIMNNCTLLNLEFIRTTCSSRGRAKRPRPRRQVKKDRKRTLSYVENLFGRQRRHRALQPAAVEWGVWIHSTNKFVRNFQQKIQNKPKVKYAIIILNSFTISKYEKVDIWPNEKTNPIQTQFKANSNPIKANNESKIRGAKPIQSQTNPFCLLFY